MALIPPASPSAIVEYGQRLRDAESNPCRPPALRIRFSHADLRGKYRATNSARPSASARPVNGSDRAQELAAEAHFGAGRNFRSHQGTSHLIMAMADLP